LNKKHSIVKKNSVTYKHSSSITKMTAKHRENLNRGNEVASATLPPVPLADSPVSMIKITRPADSPEASLDEKEVIHPEIAICTISEEEDYNP